MSSLNRQYHPCQIKRSSVWHKSSSMEKDIVPRSGIDTQRCQMVGLQPYKKGWIFGYKLHLISQYWFFPLSLYLCIGGCYTTTKMCIWQSKVYPAALKSRLQAITIRKMHYMTADPRYDDDQNLYNKHGFGVSTCVCVCVSSVHRYRNILHTHKKG